MAGKLAASLNVGLLYLPDDKTKVSELEKRLRAEDFIQLWTQEDFLPGRDKSIVFAEALADSHLILVCFSEAYHKQENQQNEESKDFHKLYNQIPNKMQELGEGREFVIPVRLEKCDLPFSVASKVIVNYYQNQAQNYERLRKALKYKADELGIISLTVSPFQTLSNLSNRLFQAEREQSQDDIILINEAIVTTAENILKQQIGELALVYSKRGRDYYQKLFYEEAIADFTRAIELNPSNAEYHRWRGQCYYEAAIANHFSGSYNFAARDFTNAIELTSENYQYYYLRGLNYYRRGDYEQALADFIQAVNNDKNNSEYHFSCGECRYTIARREHPFGDYKAAVEDITLAIQHDKEKQPLYYYTRGMAYKFMKDFDSASKDFQIAAERGFEIANVELSNLLK